MISEPVQTAVCPSLGEGVPVGQAPDQESATGS